MLKALVFDLDGTIGDTIPLCVEAFKRAIAATSGRGISDATIKAHFGPNEGGMLRILVPEKPDEALSVYLSAYETLHDDMCPRPFDGMLDILGNAKRKGYRVAMVTGKGWESADITLRHFDIAKYFESVGTGSHKAAMKEANLRKFFAATKLAPNEVAYVGDTVSDIHESRLAGVRVFSAAWAKTADVQALEAAKPDRLFRTVPEFAAFIEALPVV